MEELVKKYGFDSLEEFNHLVSNVDISNVEKKKLFLDWKDYDFTKEGLLKIM